MINMGKPIDLFKSVDPTCPFSLAQEIGFPPKEGVIFDEYRRKVSYEDFWEMVESKQKDRVDSDGNAFLIGGYNFCNREFS